MPSPAFNFSPLATRLLSEPCLIAPEALQALFLPREMAGPMRMPGMPANDPDPDGDCAVMICGSPQLVHYGGTAIIPVCGVITKCPTDEEIEYCCACDIDEVKLLAQLAASDPTVERTILLVRSPGGGITGVPECVNALRELAAQKPLFAFSDQMALSAGAWVCSAADAIYLTPSARYGSVGGYAVFPDISKSLEAQGITINAIADGKWKLAGAPFKEMSEPERGMFQANVSADVEQFRASIRDGRNIADADLQGQTFRAEDAMMKGLADGLVEGLEELIGMLVGS